MSTPARTAAEELVFRAATASIGVLVRTDNVKRAIDKLSAARTAMGEGNPEIARLVLRRNPHAPETEIFIVKAPRT